LDDVKKLTIFERKAVIRMMNKHNREIREANRKSKMKRRYR